jgi:hypothetical protein
LEKEVSDVALGWICGLIITGLTGKLVNSALLWDWSWFDDFIENVKKA